MGLLIAQGWSARCIVPGGLPSLLPGSSGGGPAEVPRRRLPVTGRYSKGSPQLPEKVLAFLVGPLVAVRHIHPHSVAPVLVGGRVALFPGHIIVEVINLTDQVQGWG